MVGIKKKRADVGIGPYKIVAFTARTKASDFCPAMSFPYSRRWQDYTIYG